MKKYFLFTLAALSTALSLYGEAQPSDCPATRWTTFGEALVWHASETSSDWAFVVNENQTKFTTKNADFGWDFGFRIGLDYTMEYDQWDTKFYYTWFRQEAKDRVNLSSGIIEPIFFTTATLANVALPNGPGGIELALPLNNGTLNWSLLFNMFDWELGRNFRVSKAFSFRPFLGLKGGWINQDIHTKFHENSAVEPIPGVDYILGSQKNDFWGVGPNLGAGARWTFGNINIHSFSLFGDAAGAYLWGHWSFLDSSHYSPSDQTFVARYPSQNYGAWMVRYLMGLEWALNWCQFHYTMQLGYEMQCWFDQLKLTGIIQGRMQEHLTLQGGVFNFSLDF